MTLDEIVAEVVAQTRRVDKTDEIRRTVRKAITQVHNVAFFKRDRQEDVLILQDPLSKFKIPLPARCRKIESLIPMSAGGAPIRITTHDNRYEYIDAADIVNSFFNSKTDTYYDTGSTLVINSSVAAPQLYVSWYQLPEVADNNLETWLMALHDNIFIDTAKMMFWQSNGRDQLARSMRDTLFQVDYQMLINNYSMGGMD